MTNDTSNSNKINLNNNQAAHHRKIGSHNFNLKGIQQRSSAEPGVGFNAQAATGEMDIPVGINSTNMMHHYNNANDETTGTTATHHQQRGSAGITKKIHTLGNSIGGPYNKKSLNISQKFGDSSINDLTLAKTGKLNNLNLSSLLKSHHLLEEDGIEDLHFYFVSFNHHKQGILKQHENSATIKRLSDAKQAQLKVLAAAAHTKPKIQIGSGSVTTNANHQIAMRNESKEKTIESVEDEDLV